jgi:hypothetical protein
LKYVGQRIPSGTATKIVCSRTFLSLSIIFFQHQCIALPFFVIHHEHQSRHGGAFFASKNLGDLSKNNLAVKELLMAILKAVENVGAHKVTGRKQGISFCCCPFINLFIVAYFFYFFFV